jgi:hypothetical protein
MSPPFPGRLVEHRAAVQDQLYRLLPKSEGWNGIAEAARRAIGAAPAPDATSATPPHPETHQRRSPARRWVRRMATSPLLPCRRAAQQRYSVALSADGNTAIVGGQYDNVNVGAAWVFTRTGGAWSQEDTKLVGAGAIGGSSDWE